MQQRGIVKQVRLGIVSGLIIVSAILLSGCNVDGINLPDAAAFNGYNPAPAASHSPHGAWSRGYFCPPGQAKKGNC